MFSVESYKFDAKWVANCSSDQRLVFCLEGGNLLLLTLRRSSVNHSRLWFVIAFSSECATAALLGARV